jgi:hypothetical protein
MIIGSTFGGILKLLRQQIYAAFSDVSIYKSEFDFDYFHVKKFDFDFLEPCIKRNVVVFTKSVC